MKEQGQIDKDGIKWYSEGYVNSTRIIARDEGKKECEKMVLDEIKKVREKSCFCKNLSIECPICCVCDGLIEGVTGDKNGQR